MVREKGGRNMETKVIEFSMTTGWEWFVQLLSIALLIPIVVGTIVLIILGVRALTIYIKKNSKK